MDFGQSVILERDKDVESDVEVDQPSVAHQAAAAGNTEKLICAIQEDPTLLEQQDGDGLTPLGHSILGRRLSPVKKLVKLGANVNAQDNLGRTGLVIAAYQGWYEGVVYMLRHGAKFHLCDKSGRTALHASTYDSDYRTMCALLHNLSTSDLNKRDHEGMTALHWGAFHNRPDHVRILLERRADIFREDVDGKTPLHWAAQKGNVQCCELLYKWKDGSLLLNHTDHAGKSPVHFAAAEGQKVVIQEFATVDDCDLESEDPDDSHATSMDKEPQECQITPLHWAVARGQPDCVALLLELGVTPNPVDAEGCTPLDYAKESHQFECQRILEDKLGLICLKDSSGNPLPQFSLTPSNNGATTFDFFKGFFGITSKTKSRIGNENSSDISNCDMKFMDMALMKEEYLSSRNNSEGSDSLKVSKTSSRSAQANDVTQDDLEQNSSYEQRGITEDKTRDVQASPATNSGRSSPSPSESDKASSSSNDNVFVHPEDSNPERVKVQGTGVVIKQSPDEVQGTGVVIKQSPDEVQGTGVLIKQSPDEVQGTGVLIKQSPDANPLPSPVRKTLSLSVEGEKLLLTKLPGSGPFSSMASGSGRRLQTLQPVNLSPREPSKPQPGLSQRHQVEKSDLAPLRGPKPRTGLTGREKVIALRMERTGVARSPTPPSWVDRPFDPLTPRQQVGRSPLVSSHVDQSQERNSLFSSPRDSPYRGSKSLTKINKDNILSGKALDSPRHGSYSMEKGDKSPSPSRLLGPQLSSSRLSGSMKENPPGYTNSRKTTQSKAGSFSREERKQLDKQLHNLLL